MLMHGNENSAPIRELSISLTEEQKKELCKIAGLPEPYSKKFIEAIEFAVRTYKTVLNRKAPAEIESEIDELVALTDRSLRLPNRKTWRPKDFDRVLEDISRKLQRLSPCAKEFLEARNIRIVFEVPGDLPAFSLSNDVVDPKCFTSTDDRLAALKELFGALSGHEWKKQGRGRVKKYAERALSANLAQAFYSHAKKSGTDTSHEFMGLCSEIKRIYRLNAWQPESIERSRRKDRSAAKRYE